MRDVRTALLAGGGKHVLLNWNGSVREQRTAMSRPRGSTASDAVRTGYGDADHRLPL